MLFMASPVKRLDKKHDRAEQAWVMFFRRGQAFAIQAPDEFESLPVQTTSVK
jgi:hypothetical protein